MSNGKKGQPQLFLQRGKFSKIGASFFENLMSIIQGSAGKLELTTRFQRNRAAISNQRDGLFVFINRLPTKLRQALKQSLDPNFGTVVLCRLVVPTLVNKLFLFGAQPKKFQRFATGFQILNQLAFGFDDRVVGRAK